MALHMEKYITCPLLYLRKILLSSYVEILEKYTNFIVCRLFQLGKLHPPSYVATPETKILHRRAELIAKGNNTSISMA
jgi:hypothetical protein